MLALAAAGCGSDEPGRASGTGRRTPADAKRSAYAEALDGLCAKRLASLEAIGNPTSPDELTQLLPKQLVVLKRFSRGFEGAPAVVRPEAKAKRNFDRFYATYLDGQIYALKTLKAGAFDGYFRVADSALAWQKQAEQTARRLGAHDCAKRPFEDQAPS